MQAHGLSRDTPIADVEALVRGVYGLGAVKRDMLRRAGLAHAGTLVALASVNRSGSARVGAVAEDLHVDVSVASRQIAALEAAGHVRRTPDPGDRRSHLVEVTPAGEAALAEAHERMKAAFASTVEAWSADDVSQLAAALTRLRDDYTQAVRDEAAEAVA